MRPPEEPSVIAAGAELIARLVQLDRQLALKSDPLAGCESVFIGQVHSGEIYNQYPQTCWLEGTRRWLPGVSRDEVERGFRGLVEQLARDTEVGFDLDFLFIRDAFQLDPDGPLARAFQSACQAIQGTPLPAGPRPSSMTATVSAAWPASPPSRTALAPADSTRSTNGSPSATWSAWPRSMP